MTGFVKTLAVLTCFVLVTACQSAEERAEEKYQSALTLLEAGDSDRAIVELRNVFELNGKHREARRLMADVLIADGKVRAGYSQYLRLVEQYPADLDGRIVLARLSFDLRNGEELTRHAKEAISLAAGDDRVKILAIALSYRDSFGKEDPIAIDNVAEDASQMLASYPDDVILRKVLIDKAIRDNKNEVALGHIDHLITLTPDDRLLYNQRLGVIARSNDPEQIENELVRMVAIFPDDIAIKSNLLQYYVSRSELDKAETFLRGLADPSDEDIGPLSDLIRFIAEVRGVDAALVEVSRGIAENPNPAPFRALRAGMLFIQGKQTEAIAELESVISGAEPGSETNAMKLQLARMLQQQSNQVGAQRLVDEVLLDETNNATALKMRAVSQIAADETDDAISGLRLALDENPDDASAMLLLSEAYTRAGSHELSRNFLALAVDASGNAPQETIRYANVLIADDRLRPAEDALLNALRIAPGNVPILALLGQVYLEMNDRPRATQVIDTLRRQDDAEATRIADQLQAIQLQRNDGSDEALQFLEQLAGQNQADVNTQLMLVRGRLATGDNEGANRLITELASENPNNGLIQFANASVKKAIGDFSGAEVALKSLISRDPTAPRLWLELADTLASQNQPEAANDAIENGLVAVPGDPNLMWGKASFLERNGDYEGAIQIYSDLYDSPANGDVVANNLASMLTNYRDDAESLERAYTVSRRLADTKVPAFQDTYGWVAYLKGDFDEAYRYLREAAIGLPEDALVQYHLAQSLVALDRLPEAITQLQVTLNVAGPADTRPQIELAREQLKDLRSQ